MSEHTFKNLNSNTVYISTLHEVPIVNCSETAFGKLFPYEETRFIQTPMRPKYTQVWGTKLAFVFHQLADVFGLEYILPQNNVHLYNI